MTKFSLFGAVAALALSSALAAPATAQQVIYNPGYCAQFYPNANCQNKGPGNPYTGNDQRRAAYRNDRAWNSHAYGNNGHWEHDSGFWPADAAADVVGDAAATAGTIATAPFRGDSYAYYNDGNRGGYDASYAARNGFVCQPGTWFKGEDGRRHICQ